MVYPIPLLLLFLPSLTQSGADAAPLEGLDLQHEKAAEDRELEPWRILLMDQAYQAASAMPEYPLIKDRSRAQERVVVTALELDQPVRALRYVEGIENWRRGAGYADYARYCAENGFHGEVEPYLVLALEVASGPTGEADQAWRRDNIVAKVAATRFLLGQDDIAQEMLGAGLELSQLGQAQAAAARHAAVEDFDIEMRALREMAKVAGMDRKQVGLQACVGLYERFHGDSARRAKLIVTIEDLWQKLPVEIQLQTLVDLADICVRKGDSERALTHLEKAMVLFDSIPWRAEFGVSWVGRLAQMTARAGDVESTRERVEQGVLLYEYEEETILGIDRADALRPLAEALHASGDREAAEAMYTRVILVGADNANARPRADDLVLTCCSMALNGYEPSEAQAEQLALVLAGLEDPW